MNLINVDVVIGVVVSASDPNNLGRVKAVVPGKWDTATMDIDALPWIYPFTMSGYQSFSKMISGSKIWVINNKVNWDEYWYLPFFELNGNTLEALGGNEESEVLISRSIGGGDVQVYYNASDGLVLKYGNSKINIKANSDIEIVSNNSEVSITGGHINIGGIDGDYEPAVKGNKTQDTFNAISAGLENLASASHSSPYTMHLYEPIMNLKKDLDSASQNILSDIVSVNG